jgi:BirA family biotin operon repressor/biotin-[acetyl-CoA-carboxylase] ligase
MIKNKIKKIAKNNNYDFFHVDSTISTMLDAKSYLNTNNRNCIFLANKQTNGIGRRGNIWHSPRGNLHCSVSINNFLEIKDHFLYSILVCVSIKMVLEKFGVKKVKFKWPNDIFYENKKIGGMISEIIKVGKSDKYMIVGFGMNIASSPEIKKYPTNYLKSFCDIQNTHDFLEPFFEFFFSNLKDLRKKDKIKMNSIFINSLMFMGENITITKPNKTILSGIFRGIGSDGSLQLEKNNIIENIYNGTIKL